MNAIHKRLKESNIEDFLVEAGLIAQCSIVQVLRGSHYNWATRLYKLFYSSYNHKPCKKKKRFLAFQNILYHEDFSEYVKNLVKVLESDNHMAKYILSIKNMIKLLFMNINSLRNKDWDNFFPQ